MLTQSTADPSEAPRRGEKPGEFSHYYLNLLALFGEERAAGEIAELARRAVSNRDRHIAQFERHVTELEEFYRLQWRSGGGRPIRDPKPLLGGWDARDIPFLRAAHDGLLVALFHYGQHRLVFHDLAVMGVPFRAQTADESGRSMPAKGSRDENRLCDSSCGVSFRCDGTGAGVSRDPATSCRRRGAAGEGRPEAG